MKTFQSKLHSKRYSFEIDIPENWSWYFQDPYDPLSRQWKELKELTFLIAFIGPEGEHLLHIAVGPLLYTEPKDSVEDTERFFQRYTSMLGYTDIESGVIRVGGKEHFWGKHRMKEIKSLLDLMGIRESDVVGKHCRDVLIKKYSLIFGVTEYVITCMLGFGNAKFTDERIRKNERKYDEIVSTFRLVPP